MVYELTLGRKRRKKRKKARTAGGSRYFFRQFRFFRWTVRKVTWDLAWYRPESGRSEVCPQ